MVTAPISKEGLHRAGIQFSGHTERIAFRAGVTRFGMLLSGGPLNVVLATRHIALREVSSALTIGVVSEAIELASEALSWLGIPEGVIGVCGLNPHAGEGGALGDEERKVILPAIEAAQRRGGKVHGPLSGDSAFYRASKGEFNLVVAMYHDQGLGPLKLVGFETGVNLTLGLPFVRTSPDHGTAFDLANRGLASPASLLEAVRWAAVLARRPCPWSRMA
jgi:4-hydroxythreonine-4-phosphate dehydrogenase